MTTQASKGQQALANGNYDEAITQLTAAIRTSQSPLWLIQRSTAYQRLGKHELALADADNAVLAAQQRGRRELIATAQFRRAIALHGLKRFGDARLCLTWCRKYNEKEKGLGLWQAKVASDYETAEKEGLSDQIQCTVKETPDPVKDIEGEQKKEGKQKTPVADAAPASAPISASQTPKEKIRHEWFQSGSTVTITIFAKGVPKEQAEINIEEGSLEVRFPVGQSGTYDYTVTPLFSRIDPTSSTFRITPHKIEISLQKAVPGLKWATLEGTEPVTSSATTASTNTTVPDAIPKPEPAKSPAYPTSSRTGPKNWDSVASAALKSDKEGGSLGDDDDFEGDPMNDFFMKLYKNADPDTKRAMMKSYQESNGTALSTNWEEVKKGPVETKPPDGVVAKKWGE